MSTNLGVPILIVILRGQESVRGPRGELRIPAAELEGRLEVDLVGGREPDRSETIDFVGSVKWRERQSSASSWVRSS